MLVDFGNIDVREVGDGGFLFVCLVLNRGRGGRGFEGGRGGGEEWRCGDEESGIVIQLHEPASEVRM